MTKNSLTDFAWQLKGGHRLLSNGIGGCALLVRLYSGAGLRTGSRIWRTIIALSVVLACCGTGGVWAADDGSAGLDAAAANLAALGDKALAATGSSVSSPARAPTPVSLAGAQPSPAHRSEADVAQLLTKDFWIGPCEGGFWMFKFGQANSVWVYSRAEDAEKYVSHYAILSGSEVVVPLSSATNRYALSPDGIGLTLDSGGLGPTVLTNGRPFTDDLGRKGRAFVEIRQ